MRYRPDDWNVEGADPEVGILEPVWLHASCAAFDPTVMESVACAQRRSVARRTVGEGVERHRVLLEIVTCPTCGTSQYWHSKEWSPNNERTYDDAGPF